MIGKNKIRIQITLEKNIYLIAKKYCKSTNQTLSKLINDLLEYGENIMENRDD